MSFAASFRDELTKAAQAKRLVYSYVPQSALPGIRAHGLHSGKSLLARPRLLAAAAAGRGVTPAAMAAQIKRTLRSPAAAGPNVLFTPIDRRTVLAGNHPTKQRKLVRVAIDFETLLRDHPTTRFYGMELRPHGTATKRERYLRPAEVRKLVATPARRLWRNYADLTGRGQYAPNVPHASVHTPSGYISPKYLRS